MRPNVRAHWVLMTPQMSPRQSRDSRCDAGSWDLTSDLWRDSHSRHGRLNRRMFAAAPALSFILQRARESHRNRAESRGFGDGQSLTFCGAELFLVRFFLGSSTHKVVFVNSNV